MFDSEKSLYPLTATISLLLARSELRYIFLTNEIRACSPEPDLLTGIVLKVPTMGGKDFGFQKKRQSKIFPEEASTLLRSCVPCILSRVAKISIPVGSHKPP